MDRTIEYEATACPIINIIHINVAILVTNIINGYA